MKVASALALVLVSLGSGFAQDKVFNWVPANSEAVRLDPGYYHAGRVYRPGAGGGNINVDIESQKPVTVAMAPEGEWNNAVQNSANLWNVNYMCVQEHVVKATFTCHLPPQHMVLVIRDERNGTDRAVLAGASTVKTGDRDIDRLMKIGIGTVMTGSGSVSRRFVSPNDLKIQYYAWLCVENCIQPEFEWQLKAKEKYKLTPLLKIYGGIFPDHEGERISVKIKSPVPMAVAVLPSTVANQLHSNPDMFESALAKSNCLQRGIQSLTWECPLNTADGPLSVVMAPEERSKVPGKKAEIEVYETKCVANCGPLPQQDKQEQDKAGQ
jgi:hypothetical protein